MRETLLLIAAAVLEVGGDAFVRYGLKAPSGVSRMAGFALGAIVLTAYGFFVNMTKLDFGRVLGIYIALFFVVSQIFSIAIFHEKLKMPTFVGGALIVAGGAVLTLWQTP